LASGCSINQENACAVFWFAQRNNDPSLLFMEKKLKKLFLKILAPNSDIQKWEATSKNSYDAPNKGITLVGFEAKLPKNSKQTLPVLLMPDMVYPMVMLKGLPALADWR
jgi:oligo-alginate lyase